MLYAKDFREKARVALKGRWASAVGTGFVASLLGAGTAFMSGGSGGGTSGSTEAYETMFSEMPQEVLIIFLIIMMAFLGIILIWSLVLFIVGGPITLGYVKYNLGLVDGEEVDIKDLFSQFHRFGDGFLMQFLRNLYIVLWMLLFIVPGFVVGIILTDATAIASASSDVIAATMAVCILVGLIPGVIFATVKEYSYTLAPYILYEHPEMSANQAIKESKKLMKGNKGRLFCLGISFIGWSILCIFTCGIGTLWLRPYQEAAFAAFYREITAEKYGRSEEYTGEILQPAK